MLLSVLQIMGLGALWINKTSSGNHGGKKTNEKPLFYLLSKKQNIPGCAGYSTQAFEHIFRVCLEQNRFARKV